MKNLKTLATYSFVLAITLLGACEASLQNDQIGGSGQAETGTNSSYARILTVGNFLYAINANELITFDANDPSDPMEVNRQDVGNDIETLFYIDGVLIIGSSSGSFTYTIEPNGVPLRRGLFDYNTLDLPVTGCDPVVADGNVAYATLYTVNTLEASCGRDVILNVLVVMDITDLENPTLITTVETVTPRGLALDGEHLFICNQFEGLTVFDVSDPSEPQVISTVSDVEAYDVIASDNKLIVVGGSELVQYDYSDPENLIRLSTISML